MKPVSLWLRPQHDLVAPANRWGFDFEETLDSSTSPDSLVRVVYVPMKAVYDEAAAQEPHWERYEPEGVAELARRGKISQKEEHEWEYEWDTVSPELEAFFEDGTIGRLGFEVYMADLTKSMKSGADFAPVLLSRAGRLIDGRHRILAAKRLGLREVPAVAYVTPSRRRGSKRR